MNKKIPERYQKSLVTVAMGFRTEEDIQKNGLHRFIKKEKKDLIKYITSLYNVHQSVLALKVKQTGYHSEHIHINSTRELNHFIKNMETIFGKDNEIWIVSSSVVACWRCRIYLSNSDLDDLFEMAYSYDDHILDHVESNSEIPYICYKKEHDKFKIINASLKEKNTLETDAILRAIFAKYFHQFKKIKQDLKRLEIEGISLDIRVHDGYDVHDFDVDYANIKKVIHYYLNEYLSM